MSTFSGKIQEIPYISIDRFDGDNLLSEAYFLSHCHSDHMVGLYYCQSNIKNNDKHLYTSEISCAILKKQFPKIKSNIKVLDIYEPTTVLLKGGNISVLPVPAGHCPGSVMFLFQTNIRILYTGDYRINKSDIRKIKSFYNPYNQIIGIEKIYLDTTFFLKSYTRFPKRKESLEEICKLIKEWVDKGENHSIELCTSAKYGYEYVFNEIFKKTGMPIHVNEEAFKFYSAIPQMDNSVTLNNSVTQIHCGCGVFYNKVCYKALNGEMRTIKISAFRWTQDNLEDGFSSNSSNIYYVCYSTHASYEEGVELLKFLKPKCVEICVKHNNPQTNLEIRELIDEVLKECRPKSQPEFKHKLFETGENISEESIVEEEIVTNNFDLGILDSPPRNTEETNKKLQIKNYTAAVSCNRKEEGNLSERIEIESEIVQKSVPNNDAPPNKKLK